MATNADIYVAAKDLVSTIDSCFLFKAQLVALKSLLLELSEHLKRERTDTCPDVHEFSDLFRRLMSFFNVNLVIKERAPRELPVLRKMRTMVNIHSLALEYEELFLELEELIKGPDMKDRFTEAYLTKVFSRTNEAKRIALDVKSTVDEFVDMDCSHITNDQSFVSKLSEVQNRVLQAIRDDNSLFNDFSFFDREDFKELLPLFDKCLLQVNRNVLFQAVTAGKKPQRRLQHAISEKDLDFSKYDDESLEKRFTGVWGQFSLATLTPPLTKQQKKKKFKSRPMKVLVQEIAAKDVGALSAKERVLLSYNIRQLENNAEHVANKYSILKYYGHVCLSTGELVVVSETVQVSLAEVLEFKIEHIFSANEVLKIALGIASALKYYHTSANIHGDVRPGNVFFASNEYDRNIKLANFSHSLDKEEEVVGGDQSRIAAFTAPETLRSGLKFESSDIYSFALVLWCLINPGEKPFQWDSKPKADIVMEIIHSNRPFIFSHGNYCKKANDEESRFHEDEWETLIEMLRFMWNNNPKDRPNAFLAVDFFEQQVEVLGTSAKRGSVFALKESLAKNPRKTRALLVGEQMELDAPEPPPREASFVVAQKRESLSEVQPKKQTDTRAGSKSSMQAIRHDSIREEIDVGNELIADESEATTLIPKNFRRYVPKKTSKSKIIRVSSKKHEDSKLFRDSSSKGNRESNQLTMPKVHKLSRDSDETAPTAVGQKYTGFDGIRRSAIQKELVEYRGDLQKAGKPVDYFDLEEETDFTMKQGLERFHFKMRIKHGIGLQRYADQDASWDIASVPPVSEPADPLPKPRLIDEDNDGAVVGLNAMMAHLKKKKVSKKKRLSLNRGNKGKATGKTLQRGSTTKGFRKRLSMKAFGSKNLRPILAIERNSLMKKRSISGSSKKTSRSGEPNVKSGTKKDSP